jgi:Uma2 family endonuclease
LVDPRERMPALPDSAAFPLAPDWLCEVLSPSTTHLDRGHKLAIYARERVPFVWLVDPLARLLEVLQLDGATYRIAAIHQGDATVRAVPFDAIELDLAGWWLPTPAG